MPPALRYVPEPTQSPTGPVLDRTVLDDLKRKQELLSAACRCLSDHRSYMFFDWLASLGGRQPEDREAFLDSLDALGAYEDSEMGTIRRLVEGGGAAAFRDLVDVVRDIRVQQEIGAMIR